ncbi:hypothetical protein BDZ45DRAFT_301695 [Acephala macrosclerotiorum]|nr:hypothetical protein BDZ45DRAFT_301695 [Acephala macrosclerotiorum]
MSIMNSTANFTRTATLPAGVTRAAAVSVLHDHDFMLQCDSDLSKYTEVTTPQHQHPAFQKIYKASHPLKRKSMRSTTMPKTSREGSGRVM